MNARCLLDKFVPFLQRLSPVQLWSCMVAVSLVMTELIVASMGWLLLGRVTFDYLLTGMVASLSVASLVVALVLYSGGQTRRLARDLAQKEERYRALVEASAQIVWTCTPRGEVVEDSPSWRAYTGQTVEQWLGYGYMECIHPADRGTAMARWQEALVRGRQYVNRHRLRHHSGEWRWSLARGVPLHDPDGAVTAWVGMNIDIQDQERAKYALQAAKEAAEAASVAKSRFLATMSHEIRTPLNGILGMAQLLLMPGLMERERQEYAETILYSGETLLTLLNDVLDLSKVEAGKLQLAPTPCSPRQIVGETAALFADQARSKGLAFEAVWHGKGEEKYWADGVRLRQMLSNLISNAIKFTTRGFVHIDAVEIHREGGRAMLEFAVTDSGIGIPPDKRSLLFRPFSQADSSTTREFGGTGLGLSIVRSLARLMGGEADFESGGAGGARFWFRVGAGVLEKGEAASHGGQRAGAGGMGDRPARVLVVEDNRTNRRVAEALLRRLNVLVESAENGREAVDAIVVGPRPDLILMDCQMAIMDGFEATERIRQWERDTGQSRLPIIALTAGAFEEDRRRCFAVGMDDFLAKPISLEGLAAVLAKWLRREQERAWFADS